MTNTINKPKIYVGIALLIMFCGLFVVGCNSNKLNIYEQIVVNMTEISTTLDKVKNIENEELIIDDFMNEDELSIIQTTLQDSTTTPSMNKYFIKLNNLNNNIVSTISINDNINIIKRKLYTKVSQIKSMCGQCLDWKVNEPDKNGAIKEFNDALMENATRVRISRNEVNNNLKNVTDFKENYSSQTNKLSSRYTRLKTSLNTRYTYYLNMLNNLEQIQNILNESFYSQDNITLPDQYLKNESNFNNSPLPIPEETIDEMQNDSYNETENIAVEMNEDDEIQSQNDTKSCANTEKKSNKKLFKKNIDTYENAGVPINNYNRNYNNGYPVGSPYNNMYGNMYGGNMYGFGGMYSPYGVGGYGLGGYPMGGYMGGYSAYGGYYPNINTYWGIKNIDTYKSPKVVNNDVSVQSSFQSDNSIIFPEKYETNGTYEFDKENDKTNNDITLNSHLEKEYDGQEEHFVNSQIESNKKEL